MTHKLNLRFGRKSPSFSQVCWEHKYYLHNFHVLFYNDLKFQGEFVEVEKTQSFFFSQQVSILVCFREGGTETN